MFARIVSLLTASLTLWLASCHSFTPYAPKAEAKAVKEFNTTTLKGAQHLLNRAHDLDRFETVAAVYRLRAAQIAWDSLASARSSKRTLSQFTSDERLALNILNNSQSGLVQHLIESEKHSLSLKYGGLTYQLQTPTHHKSGEFTIQNFTSVKAASAVPEKLCLNFIKNEGIGEPLSAHWKSPRDERYKRFSSRRGYLQPVTSTMTFSSGGQGNLATINFHNPTLIQQVPFGQNRLPLANNFTAPIVDLTSDIKEISLSFAGVFNPINQDAELRFLEPYDPNRIPVILVHGLLSHPRMWRDVYNELRADPALRGKYQFWSFRYPSGWPILYSAMKLREEMAAVDKAFGRQHSVVLIGHSMGGLLSRLQVVDPGHQLLHTNLKLNPNASLDHPRISKLARRIMVFESNPNVGRVIFICVPHRGSSIADWSIVGYIAKLIKIPQDIIKIAVEIVGDQDRVTKLTSIQRLSPSNPTFQVLDKLPIQAPYHSIIGDRGKGNTPKSSDGAVEYWSSHLEGAESELIIPDDHGAYDHPLAIAEMKRILTLHWKNQASRRR